MYCDSYLFRTVLKVAGAACSVVCKDGLVNRLDSKPQAQWHRCLRWRFPVTLSPS